MFTVYAWELKISLSGEWNLFFLSFLSASFNLDIMLSFVVTGSSLTATSSSGSGSGSDSSATFLAARPLLAGTAEIS